MVIVSLIVLFSEDSEVLESYEILDYSNVVMV